MKNIWALKKLINEQKVTYDFKYYEMSFDADIPVLILSEGKSLLPVCFSFSKSMVKNIIDYNFQSDCCIPSKPAEICIESFEQLVKNMAEYLTPDRLTSIRVYLTHARMGKYELSEQVQDVSPYLNLIILRNNFKKCAFLIVVRFLILTFMFSKKVIQNDFVAMRKDNKISGGSSLHNLLVLARLICLSEGKSTLDEECWKKACGLDERLRERSKC